MLIDASDLHAAIQKVEPKLLTGQRGFLLVERLPQIAKRLSILLGACCAACCNDLPDAACVADDGRMLCCECYGKDISTDDLAVPPGAPFAGSGQRIIRKTGGLT